MSAAKRLRLGRILQKSSRRSVIVPIDHGLTIGPVEGIESIHRISEWITDPHIDAVLAHKGVITRLAERDLLQGKGVILHLNGMSTLADNPDAKEPLTGVQQALALGVDALSLQVNFTGQNDRANWRQLGRAVDEASRYGFPVLTMLYDKVRAERPAERVRRLRHLMRTAVELGTDAIKISLPLHADEAQAVLADLSEDVLVLVAGGELAADREVLGLVASAMESGASGVCMGRNVFSRPQPSEFLERLARVVHEGSLRPVTRGELIHAS